MPRTRNLTLPRTTGPGAGARHVSGNLSSSRNEWRTNNGGGHVDKLSGSTICAYIVLIGSKLTALRGDSLQVLLGRSVGIANLEEETFLTNWLAMELLDNLLADVTALKAVIVLDEYFTAGRGISHRAKPTPRLFLRSSRRILLERTV